MKFQVNGPFRVPRNCNRLVARDASAKREFWMQVDAAERGLSAACGCYIFVLSPRGGGAKPWYVGMTEKRGFRDECFQPHKINLYNEALAGYDKASPCLYLISKLTSGGKEFAQSSANGHADIVALEDFLIGIAYSQNQELLNIRGTKFFKKAVIPGLMNTPPGRLLPPQAAIRRLLLW
jgi:hypothetical protein